MGLNIDYEFKRGFLFVRLFGSIGVDNYSSFIKELDDIVIGIGIKKIVLNIDNITDIDIGCLNKLLKYIKVKVYSGILILICDNKVFLSDDTLLKINYEKEVYNLV